METDPTATTFSADDESGSSSPPVLGARYELLALLGSGGMGNVYKARDRELDDVVALKVLRPEVAGTPGVLERFRRELKLARRVTHPNVARVFDIGEFAGDKIITMELVMGESLATLIEREGALPVPRVLEIASAICAGVAAAHAAGVVHRDLKPDNVLLGTDGRILVTDFGIACGASAGEAGATVATVGTPAYMAPEQLDRPSSVDHRADIYALGEILFEMLAGERAWQGETVFAIAAARLLSPPPSAQARRPGVDPRLAQIALECMASRPEDRYASMQAVVSALSAITPREPVSIATRRPDTAVFETPAGHGHKRVAVLPIRNAGPLSDEHIADGLTDDLIDLLSMSRTLRVSSRGVVMRHKGTDHDPRDIGRELGVQVVVEGSVRRSTGTLRIQARLVSVSDGFQLWAKRFDGVDADLLTLSDQVARAVAAALTVDLEGEVRGQAHDAEAIDLYMRARERQLSYFGPAWMEARELFSKALSRSPDDPRIIAGYVLTQAPSMRDLSHAQALRAEAERALRLAPSLPDAHVALAALHFQSNEAVEAVAPLLRAIKLQNNHAEAHDMLGRLLLEADVASGIRHVETASALEPNMGLPLTALARYLLLHGDSERSDAVLDGIKDDEFRASNRARSVLWWRDAERARQLAAGVSASGVFAPTHARLLDLATNGTRFEEHDLSAGERRAARTVAYLRQLDAEAACFMNEPDRAMRDIVTADALQLFDFAWLERCPALDMLRDRADFEPIHDRVAERARCVRAAYEAGT